MSRDRTIELLLIAATVIVYGQVVGFDFVRWDDQWYVTENPRVQHGLTRDGILWAFTSTHGGNWHPLTGLSHMLDCSLYGLHPVGHHITSLLLHIVNTLLLFRVFRSMRCALGPSAFVAALFAVHPLHVESVAWISERKDVLSTLFGLLSMRAYVDYAHRGGRGRYARTAVLFALALAAKPMLVTLPFVFLLLDYWPLDRMRTGPETHPPAQGRPRRRGMRRASHRRLGDLLIEKIPLLVLSAGASIVTALVQGRAGNLEYAASVPVHLRVANAIVSYVRYIGKTLWPADLSILYPHPNLPGGVPWTTWQVAGAALLLLAITAAVASTAERRYALVGWLWYLGTLVPVIGVVQAGRQAMADRYTYVPAIGLFIVLAWGARDLLARWSDRQGFARQVTVLAAMGVVVACMAGAWFQARYWRDSVVLFERALVVTPRSAVMHNALGSVLDLRGHHAEAASHYQQALQVDPTNALAHYNLGSGFQNQGRLDDAIAHYRQALASEPDYAVAHNNLASILMAQGRREEAIRHYRLAVQFQPEYAVAHNNLANALQSEGATDEAILHYQRAVQARPDYAAAQYNLARMLHAQRRFDEAIRHYRKAVEAQPDLAAAHENLGLILQALGEHSEAERHLDAARRARTP